ncbi:hypothetical protein RvY_00315 [Ramazzottius varieornatus]|uniref:Protein YIPF n=1 Tax=Ramazzottius varieornatus TaxID=947166 RepID=A0A1D1UG11_RAMVA|nr:hypothetical protein RvY_00315 [Ramazzottius varieornatus]
MSGYADEPAGFYPSSYAWSDPAAAAGVPGGPPIPNMMTPGVSAPPGPMYNPLAYGGPQATANMYAQQNDAVSQRFAQAGGYTGDDVEHEPPLLEELGINFDHILQKTMTVLNPFRRPDVTIMSDSDLAGPFVFCLLFGGLLLLHGKIHFGYIYGIGLLGCLGMYSLLSLMSVQGVSIGCVVSVLGYCLLPMVLLSAISIIATLQGLLGMIGVGLTILWCSWSASKLFVTALSMDHQQPLVAYPCALLYGVFSLLTVF